MDYPLDALRLSEPLVPDDTFARRGEATLAWLKRSTSARAKDCRRFLNEHISQLPPDTQSRLWNDLRSRWHSAFFELIVARLLQELGASVVVESINSEGKRPDFAAHFPDAVATIEAKAPMFDAPAGEELAKQAPLLDFIESKVPPGWLVGVWQLPNIGPNDSKRAFKHTVEEMLRIPPPSAVDEDKELVAELPSGTVHLRLIPRSPATTQLAWGAPVTVVDSSEERIRHTVRSARRQVRGSSTPVLLAIQASGISSDFETFDRALFGRSYSRYDEWNTLVETGFKPDGVFNEQRLKAPTYAGVLAFLAVGFNTCVGPVLYRHPRFSGVLPEALLGLEQRMYEESSNEIKIESSRVAVADRLNLVCR